MPHVVWGLEYVSNRCFYLRTSTCLETDRARKAELFVIVRDIRGAMNARSYLWRCETRVRIYLYVLSDQWVVYAPSPVERA